MIVEQYEWRQSLANRGTSEGGAGGSAFYRNKRAVREERSLAFPRIEDHILITSQAQDIGSPFLARILPRTSVRRTFRAETKAAPRLNRKMMSLCLFAASITIYTTRAYHRTSDYCIFAPSA